MPLSDSIRNALKTSGRLDSEVAAACGVHPVSLSRFKNGLKGLSVENLEKLAAALGLKITVQKSGRKSR